MLKTATLVMAGIVGLTVPAAAEDVRQAIEQVNAQVMAAFKAGDAAAIASHYSDTAKMLPPDTTEIAGREAIQNLWQSWLDDGLKDSDSGGDRGGGERRSRLRDRLVQPTGARREQYDDDRHR